MKLLQAYLDIHSSCNYKCTYCFRKLSSSDEPKGGPIQVDVYDKLTLALKELCWSVSISCAGEPLLHPQFSEILEITNKKIAGLDVSMATNGFLLDDKKQDALGKSCLSRISISVDTVNPALYKTICGCSENALETVLNNVGSFANKLAKIKNGPKLFITAIAMQSTLPHLPELAARFSGMGVDGVKIQWLVPYSEDTQREVVVYDTATATILKEVEKILKSRGVFFDYPNVQTIKKIISIAHLVSSYKNKREYILFSLAKVMASRKNHTCRLAGTYLQVLQDGTMYVCPKYEGPATPLCGSIGELSSSVYKAIKQIKHAPDYTACPTCRFLSDNLHKSDVLS